ncbi:MAG: Xaa-Pro peptidase family protein [Aerococcaceae bacterium]|nr:Xaa-Pro peptidase family protein [Aerococcaceae bacterium]
MSRIQNVRTKLQQHGLDALIVTDLYNLRYLANFTGSTGVAVISQHDAVFITDFRYTEQAANQATGYTIRQNKQEIFAEVNDYLNEKNLKKVAIEADEMTVATYLHIKQFFTAEIVETRGFVEEIRQIKTPEEIAIIQESCDLADDAFAYILTYIKVGMTEIQVANELERYLKSKGASAMSFDTIVASGVRSAMPHGVATDKVIEDGDLITLDFGCYYKGYSSDMTRTFAIGSVNPKLEEIYHIVLEAHELVNQQAKPGMTGKEVDAIARDYIKQKGYGDYFGHGLGHGLGLNVHELPGVNGRNEQPLQENMVITNEPGIYIEGLGGVRIEDDLLVTATGVKSFNRSPKNLIIL